MSNPGAASRVRSQSFQSNVKRVVVLDEAARPAQTENHGTKIKGRLAPALQALALTCSRPLHECPHMTRGAVALAILAAALIVAVIFGLEAFSRIEAQQSDEPAIDFAHPTRHFRVPNPARLSDADALSIYDRIRDEMVSAYRLSRDPVATQFYKWRRYNRVPYLSATHGDRYINNHANAKAKTYGRGDAGPMPAGAVLAKDSFTVTRQGDVFTGPLFIMEKMAPGFSAATRDWRYTMIMPDGSLFGTTNGEGSDKVEFCASCHATAGDAADHLFFVPEKYRTQFLRPDEAK
jgi:hypothetical protein